MRTQMNVVIEVLPAVFAEPGARLLQAAMKRAAAAAGSHARMAATVDAVARTEVRLPA